MTNDININRRTAETIKEVCELALEHIPIQISNTDISPGRKVFFPIPMKKMPKDMADFVYVFAESRLIGPPKNKKYFTEEDIFDDTGVYIFTRNNNLLCGNTFSLTDFMKYVKADLSLRNRLIYRINEMRNIAHLDESFIELANNELSINKKYEYFTNFIN